MRLAFLVFIVSFPVISSEISLDIGQTKTVFNRISIPKSQADQIVTPTDEAITSYRFTGYWDLASGNQLYFLIAPLEVSYKFTSDKDFRFNKTDFREAESTTFNYKFNSYRLGYLWHWKSDALRYWGGITGKIRDAKTEIVQDSTSDSFSNVGFVPLLSLGLEWPLGHNFSIFSHTDALGSNRGSAYDANAELRYRQQNYAFSLGHRILGGGADNENVYNFAQFDTTYLRISREF